MDCTTAWKWMMQALDASLPAERERDLLLHLGACPDCREMWNAMADMAIQLPEIHQQSMQDAPEPDLLWQQVRAGMTTVTPVAQEMPRNGNTPVLTGLVLMALLLVGMVAGGTSNVFGLLGRVAGWLYAGLERLGSLFGLLLGPEWVVAGEWVLLLACGVLLYLGGKGLRRNLPEEATTFGHATAEQLWREGRLNG